jgi:hypothetical protein
MKNSLIHLCLLVVASISAAADMGNYGLTAGALDFVAPVVYDRATLTSATAGTIVYDSKATQAGAYLLPPTVDPSNFSNWVRLAGPTGTNTVISSGTMRVETAILSGIGTTTNCPGGATPANACSLSMNTSGITSIVRSGGGIYTVNFDPTIWNSAPGCVFNAIDSTDAYSYPVSNGYTPSTTTFEQTFFSKQTGNQTDTKFVVICTGL